jgi:hypothetical protein
MFLLILNVYFLKTVSLQLEEWNYYAEWKPADSDKVRPLDLELGIYLSTSYRRK